MYQNNASITSITIFFLSLFTDVKVPNGRYKKNSNGRLVVPHTKTRPLSNDKGLQAVLMRLQVPDAENCGKGYLAPLGGDGGYGGSSDDVLHTSLSPPRERHETASTTGTRDSGCSSAEGSTDGMDHLGLPEDDVRPGSRQSQSTDLSCDDTDDTSSDDTPSFTEFTRV